MSKADVGQFDASVLVNIGVDSSDLVNVANTLKEIAKGKDLQKYFKDSETAIKNTTKAMETFNKRKNGSGASSAASDLIKQFNSLKAIVGKDDLSNIFPTINVNELMDSAKRLASGINEEFSVKNFSNAFKTFEAFEKQGLELNEVFSSLSKYRKLLDDFYKIKGENYDLKSIIGDGNDIEKLKQSVREIENLRNNYRNTFSSFLNVNNIPDDDWRIAEYFDKISTGSLTAQEAINKFKMEFSHLFDNSQANVGLEQIQMFSDKLSSLFVQVETISQKINEILLNGVVTKTIEKIGTEQNNITQNTKSVDTKNFSELENILQRIESNLSSIKGVLTDVGDGEELSPLLSMINRVNDSVLQMNSSVKGIGLNMNVDFGSNKEMESKAEAKISNALQAYQRLFDHIKMSGVGGSIINTKFFDFDINQYDTAMSKLQAYKKFIENMRNEAKAQFNGQDVLYTDTDKKYWKQASSATGQITKVFNEMKAASNTNPLENIFGKTDFTGVINQLNTIVSKLDEISTSANQFVDTFKSGLNINTSVEEINKLTIKVKELEDELAKVKAVTPGSNVESNISNGTKDAFQGNDSSASVQETTEAIREQNTALEENANRIKESVNELIKGRDIISQQWYKEKDTVVGKDLKGNNITRDVNQFSFIERLQNGQLQTVVATLDEKTGKWVEQVINVRTAFEQVEKAIISADNKINSLENDRDKTLAAHPGYDASADNALINAEKAHRAELQKTLDLYATEKEYVYQIEAANKRIAANQERLRNVSAKKSNQGNVISDEKISKQLEKQLEKEEKKLINIQKKRWKNFQKEQNAYNEYSKTMQELDNLPVYEKNTTLDKQYMNVIDGVDELNSKLKSGKISISNYKKEISSLFSEYQRFVDIIHGGKDVENASSKKKAVNAALTEQLKAYKDICNVREKLARLKDGKDNDKIIQKLNKQKELYLNNFKIASKFLEENELFFDVSKQHKKILEQYLKYRTKIAEINKKNNETKKDTSIDNATIKSIEAAKNKINSLKKSLNELKNTNGFRKVNQEFNSLLNSSKSFTALSDYQDAIKKMRKLISEANKINNATKSSLERVNRQFSSLSDSEVLKTNFAKRLAEDSLSLQRLNENFKNGVISQEEFNASTRRILSNLSELRKLGNGTILGDVNSVMSIDAAKQQVLNYINGNNSKISKPVQITAPDKNGIRTITTEIITQQNEIQKLTAKWSAATNTVSLSTKEMGTAVSASTKIFQEFANKWKQLAQYMTAMYLNPYMLIYRIKDLITTISDLDYELMDLRKTADMSTSELHEFYLESNDVAKEMGVSTKEILSQASAWSRLNKIGLLYGDI